MIQAGLQQLDPRSLRLILVLVWAVLAAALLMYVLKPQVLSYRQGAESRHLLEHRLGDEIQLKRDIDSVRLEVDALRQRLQGDVEDVPLNQMESYLIGRLQGVSWGANVELVGVKPGHATRVLGFEEMAFEVEVRADYQALYAWLGELAEKLGFILVKRYDIAPVGADKEADMLRMKLTMVFYRKIRG
ncbi:MAG: hypothetical protein ABF290_03840 [Thiogranum sp.]